MAPALCWMSKTIPASIDHPAIYVRGGAVKTTEDSPFTLEVFIKETDPNTGREDYTPCAAREQNGQAYIDLDVGQSRKDLRQTRPQYSAALGVGALVRCGGEAGPSAEDQAIVWR